jgi:hypothetical protein
MIKALLRSLTPVYQPTVIASYKRYKIIVALLPLLGSNNQL